jgi:hypothetical protein
MEWSGVWNTFKRHLLEWPPELVTVKQAGLHEFDMAGRVAAQGRWS